MGEGSEREQWHLLCSLLDFSHFPHYHKQTGPFWCWFQGGWACVHSRTLWVSPMNSPVRLGVSPTAASSCTGVFNQRFEALFPQAGALVCAVCLTPQLFLPVYLHANEGPPAPPATSLQGSPAPALPWVLSARLPVSAPPTALNECFFFNSLIVRIPYSSIFCQVWLFFVFKLLFSFFWLFEEAQCVYLCLHRSQKSGFPFFLRDKWLANLRLRGEDIYLIKMILPHFTCHISDKELKIWRRKSQSWLKTIPSPSSLPNLKK